jgi:Ca2+-binding EF-hand superfamily protein
MKTLFFGSAALAAVLASGVAVAQPAPATPTPPQHVAKTQTRADLQGHIAKMFARLDTNHDGVIVRQEVDAAQAQFADRMKQRAEQAGPKGDRSKAFDRIDSNDDGNISRQEFASAPRGPGKAKAGMRGGFAGRMFDMADINKDGRVTLPEVQQAALQHFDRADLNRDGTLTPEERRQARQQAPGQPRS